MYVLLGKFDTGQDMFLGLFHTRLECIQYLNNHAQEIEYSMGEYFVIGTDFPEERIKVQDKVVTIYSLPESE